MSEDVLLDADVAPKNGRWIDSCNLIAYGRTKEEVSHGNLLGLTIDPEDDADSGIVKTIASRALTEHEKAKAKARALKDIMLEYGVPEVSIELQTGRPTSYGSWDALFVVAEMSHHTVSRYSSTSRTPCLSLIKNGRSDLPGPLSNGYGGWDLCYRIITFGYANHPGEGGPITLPALTAGTFTIPKDSARRYAWGTEWEGGLAEADWDKVLTNPRNGKKMTFREFMGRANAALEAYHKIHQRAHMEHSTWTSRKIDRLHYTAQKGITEKAAYRSPQPQGDWFDMADKEDLRAVVEDVVINKLGFANIIVETNDAGSKDDVKWNLNRVARELLNDEDRLKRALDLRLDDLTTKITEEIRNASGGQVASYPPEEMRRAVETGLRNVLGSLND